MVFLTYKKNEKNSFAIECPANAKVSHVLAILVECKPTFIKSITYESTLIALFGALKKSPIKECSSLQNFKESLGKTTPNIKNNFSISPQK